MSDYLGLNQTRVLDSTNRSFESVIYQRAKPPLSSEVNLNGNIEASRDQHNMQALLPSGWLSVGQIKDGTDPAACKTGDVLCSPGYANTFKLIATDLGKTTEQNIALINGWRVVVQGGSSPSNVESGYTVPTNNTEDCLITLPPPPETGSRVDFVFLEAWRKLVTPDDPIYQYGNVDHPSPYPNDLIDPARGFETSLRVQVQYRLRVAEIDDLNIHPDGMSAPSVFLQGPLAAPTSMSTHAGFSPVPGDPGLWRAGAGDAVDQEIIGTVDGYTYGIPLFAIRRRSTEAYDPRVAPNGSAKSLTDYLNGYASDRPDNLYSDWIVAEDFLDLRHKVSVSTDFQSICTEAFRDLQANTLHTHMGVENLGGESHGVTKIEVDAVSDGFATSGWANYLGYGNGYRRVYSNAVKTETFYIIKTVNDKIVGSIGSVWATSDQIAVDLSTIPGFPAHATIVSIPNGIYNYGLGGVSVNLHTASNTGTVMNLTINGGWVVGTSTPLLLPINISYAAGAHGLTEVPTQFLEARKYIGYPNIMYPIAMKDQDIRVRYNGDSSAVSTIDRGAQCNMLRARGGDTKHNYDFGHQMVYHIPGNGNNILTFHSPLGAAVNGSGGYNILGVANIKADGTATVPNPSISITDSTFTVNFGFNLGVGKDAELTLYTDSKYFIGNKQGRSIYDCYQMMALAPVEPEGLGRTQFTLDVLGDSSSTPRTIMAIGSYGDMDGTGYAYIDNGGGTLVQTSLLTANNAFPVDATTSNSIQFPSAPTGAITVPVLVKTAIDPTEAYAFFYKHSVYQGLNTPGYVTGAIECVGPAITTTSGSGAIVDSTYSIGQMAFHGTTGVSGSGTSWMGLVDSSSGSLKARYVLAATADSYKRYPVKAITSDTYLVLESPADRVSGGFENYVLTAMDQPSTMYSNIIDRLPAKSEGNDYLGANAQISFANTDPADTLETRIVSKIQDLTTVPVNTMQIGVNPTLDSPPFNRGRTTVYLPKAKLGKGNMGLKFEKLSSGVGAYKKTYQSYILNKDDSGRLYLVVVGSETGNTSASCALNEQSNDDSVDIFELPGRPIVSNRK